MVDVTGISGAGPIWNQFMRRALLGQPELEFQRPPGIVAQEVCALSGLLPTPACPHRRTEWFVDGTATNRDQTRSLPDLRRSIAAPACWQTTRPHRNRSC